MMLRSPWHPSQRTHRSTRRILTGAGRLAMLFMLMTGLWGCSLTQNLPAQATTAPTVAPLSSPAAPQAPAPLVTTAAAPQAPAPTFTQESAPPQPTATPLPVQPTYTALPTYTPYPTQLPPPINTPFPTPTQILIAPVSTPTAYLGIQPGGTCCTLRVRNRGRDSIWIGTYMPYGGNYIDPLYYVEFYLPEPGRLRVYWCDYARYSERLFDCRDEVFDVPDGLTEVSVY